MKSQSLEDFIFVSGLPEQCRLSQRRAAIFGRPALARGQRHCPIEKEDLGILEATPTPVNPDIASIRSPPTTRSWLGPWPLLVELAVVANQPAQLAADGQAGRAKPEILHGESWLPHTART